MYYASEEAQRQLVHDCFNQNRERDCHRCPANFSRQGICCFGDPDQHNPDDDDCQKCVFVHECAEEVKDLKRQEEDRIEREAERQNRWMTPSSSAYRTTIPIRRPLNPSTTIRPPGQMQQQQKNDLVQIGGLAKRPSVITPPSAMKAYELSEGETLFQRFVKDTVWGMGQGFFETAADFFRSHRLR